MKYLKWEFPLIVWTLVLLILTWYPKVEIPDIGINAEDKIAHLLVFGFWGFLLSRAVSKYEINRLPFTVKVAVFTGTLFAIIDECVQGFIPGRYLTFYDGLANVFGVWLSVFLFVYLVIPIKRRQTQKQAHQ